MTTNLMLGLIALPVVAALAAPAIGTLCPRWRPTWYVLAHLGTLLLALAALSGGPAGAVVEVQRGPVAAQFVLTHDQGTGVALVFAALLLLVIGWFSRGYVRRARHGAAFLSLLLLEQAAVNLVLLSGDLLALYGGMLSLSLVLTLMIGLDFGPTGSAAALRLLATIEVPSAFAFVGFWLIDARAGTLAFADLARNDGWLSYPGSGALILPIVVALACRTGLTPLQTWVVAGCRAAATPVAIAIVGVALPVGGLVLARLVGVVIPLGAAWMHGLVILAIATALVGGIGAWREKSALGWLGYLAVGQVALAVAGFAIGGTIGPLAGGIGLTSTGLATSLVGMGIGTAIRAAGQDRFGVWSHLPRSPAARIALLVGLLALIPLPPLPSFTARRLLLVSALDGSSDWSRFVAAGIFVGTIALAVPIWRVILELAAAHGELVRSHHSAVDDGGARPRVSRGGGIPSDAGAFSSEEREFSGPMIALAGLIGLFGLLPLAWLAYWMGMGRLGTLSVVDFTATILVFLAMGGVPLVGLLALHRSPPERLVELLSWIVRWGRLDLALDPYVLIGGMLLAVGRFSAIALDQTLGRLARAR